MSIAPADHRPARRLAPEAVAVASVAVLVLAAWAALLLEAHRLGGGGADAFLQAICRPAGVRANDVSALLSDAAVNAGFWMVMSVGMMLPTAVPMVLGFASIGIKGTPSGSAGPVLLIAGYLGVWLAVSIAAAVLQVGAGQLAARVPLPPAAGTILAGMLIGAAGLYQFSPWKMAFLGACRHPLPDLEAGIALAVPALRLGVGQGVRCLGCCGPMMAIMLVAGAMNVAWMGIFAIIMTVEKMTSGPVVPRVVGSLLLAAGGALAVSAVGPGAILAFLMRG